MLARSLRLLNVDVIPNSACAPIVTDRTGTEFRLTGRGGRLVLRSGTDKPTDEQVVPDAWLDALLVGRSIIPAALDAGLSITTPFLPPGRSILLPGRSIIPAALLSGRSVAPATPNGGRSIFVYEIRVWRLLKVSLPDVAEDVVEGDRCFFGERRMMPFVGMYDPELRGDGLGGVLLTGPGSLLRAWWTLCSSLCICPISPRIWCKDRDGGNGIDVLIAELKDGPRFCRVFGNCLGRGVSEGSLTLDVAVEISDMGGEGGVGEWSDCGVDVDMAEAVVGVVGECEVTDDDVSDMGDWRLGGGT